MNIRIEKDNKTVVEGTLEFMEGAGGKNAQFFLQTKDEEFKIFFESSVEEFIAFKKDIDVVLRH